MDVYESLGVPLKQQATFVYLDIQEGIQKQIADEMGVRQEDLPTLRMKYKDRNDPSKYHELKPAFTPAEMTREKIMKWIAKADKKNKLDMTGWKIQEFPEEDDAQEEGVFMKHLVDVNAADFESIVMDVDNDVLLILCDQTYEICQNGEGTGLASLFNSLANVFSSSEFHDFTVALFDPAQNDMHRTWGTMPTKYPTFRYYSKQNKRIPPIDFDEEKISIENVMNFGRNQRLQKYARFEQLITAPPQKIRKLLTPAERQARKELVAKQLEERERKYREHEQLKADEEVARRLEAEEEAAREAAAVAAMEAEKADEEAKKEEKDEL